MHALQPASVRGAHPIAPLMTAPFQHEPSAAGCAIGALMHAYLGPAVNATAVALRWDQLMGAEQDSGRANDAIVAELAWNHPHRHWIRLALADAITCLQRSASAD
jgi:hypothetical protein